MIVYDLAQWLAMVDWGAMQFEVMMTGIGGQGVQLCAKTLALGAVREERLAMLCGHYAGAIRGGQTDASIVVAEDNLRALPILPSSWSGFVMSPQYWGSTREFIRPGGPVMVNSSLIGHDLETVGLEVFPIPASEIAAEELSAPMGASMVLLGAFSAVTGLVGIDALVLAMKELVPPYRTEHVVANEVALHAGYSVGPKLAAPAWPTAPVAAERASA
jgi:2-oxoglutarate ferredoxin oxidoreductase subunit gamma